MVCSAARCVADFHPEFEVAAMATFAKNAPIVRRHLAPKPVIRNDTRPGMRASQQPLGALDVCEEATLGETHGLIEMASAGPDVLLERIEEVDGVERLDVDRVERPVKETCSVHPQTRGCGLRRQDEVLAMLDPDERGARHGSADDAELSRSRPHIENAGGGTLDKELCGAHCH
jgi:hypothetical protein